MPLVAGDAVVPAPPPRALPRETIVLSDDSLDLDQVSSEAELEDSDYTRWKREMAAAREEKAAAREEKAAAPEKKPAPAKKAKSPYEMAAELGVHHVTTVDVGRVNCAVMRFSTEHACVTHCYLLNLDDLCRRREREHPALRLADNAGAFSHDTRQHALTLWLREQAVPGSGRCFDSALVVVERQVFLKEMAAYQAIFHAALVNVRAPIVIRGEFELPTYWPLAADSVKSFFAPLFPNQSDATAKRRPFGVGDVHRSAEQQRQHGVNKRQAIRWGRRILAAEDLFSQLDASLAREFITADEHKAMQDTLRSSAKRDDVYDTLFMFLYALDVIVPHFYRRHVVKKSARSVSAVAFASVSLPATKRYRALYEFMQKSGASQARYEEVKAALEGGAE